VKALFVLYNLLMAGSFVGHYVVIGREQINPAKSDIHAYLLKCWGDGFPPANPLKWPLWWLDLQTGRMMAYPCGDAHGGSGVTFVLFLVGCAVWWKTGRRQLLVLLLAPFALNLLAAFLHKYPYGSCGRVSQHLAPASCLLAGTGLAHLIERFTRSRRARLDCARLAAAVFLVVMVGIMVFQARRPHRDDDDGPWTRGVVRELMGRVKPGEPVVVFCEELSQANGAVLWWYLSTQKQPVTWAGALGSRLGPVPGKGCVWVCDQRRGAHPTPRQEAIDWWARQSGRQTVGVVSWLFQPRGFGIGAAHRVDVYLCAPPGQKVKMPLFSQWPGL
jgi:hypothetical protein